MFSDRSSRCWGLNVLVCFCLSSFYRLISSLWATVGDHKSRRWEISTAKKSLIEKKKWRERLCVSSKSICDKIAVKWWMKTDSVVEWTLTEPLSIKPIDWLIDSKRYTQEIYQSGLRSAVHSSKVVRTSLLSKMSWVESWRDNPDLGPFWRLETTRTLIQILLPQTNLEHLIDAPQDRKRVVYFLLNSEYKAHILSDEKLHMLRIWYELTDYKITFKAQKSFQNNFWC